jgi:hypothetical protein
VVSTSTHLVKPSLIASAFLYTRFYAAIIYFAWIA